MRWFIILCLIGLASTLPTDLAKVNNDFESLDGKASSRLLEGIITDLLDFIRDLMQNGSDTIPVLDPLEVPAINIDGAVIGFPESRVILNDLSVVGLSTFDIDQLDVSMTSLLLQRYRVDFNGYIPIINADTDDYDIYIGIFGGEIFGKGDMKLALVNPRVIGNLEVQLQISLTGIFITLRDCRISFSLEAFNPTISGMFGNEISSAFVSEFLSILIPELLEFFEAELTEILSTVVLTVGNAILEDLNIFDLIGSSQALSEVRAKYASTTYVVTT